MLIQPYTDGICMALYEEFGSSYEIYTESLEQGLNEPCFSVLPGDITITPANGGQYLVAMQYTIRYYPADEDGYADCGAILERMYDALGLVAVGSAFVRAMEFSGAVDDDGVLVVSFLFERLYTKTAEAELMQTLGATLKPE